MKYDFRYRNNKTFIKVNIKSLESERKYINEK